MALQTMTHTMPNHSFNDKTSIPSFYPSQTQFQPSTVALAGFASDLEKEITEKVLKTLQLEKSDSNNVILVSICRLIDDVMYNIKFEQTFSNLFKQQQQIIDNNNKNINIVLKKLNIFCDANIVNEKSNIAYDLNHNKTQLKEIMRELNNIKNMQSNNFKGHQDITNNQKKNSIQLNNLNNNQIAWNGNISNQMGNIQKVLRKQNNELKEMNEEYKNIIYDHQDDAFSTSIAVQSLREGFRDVQNSLDTLKFSKRQPIESIDNESISILSKTIKDDNVNGQLLKTQKDIMSNVNKIENEVADIDANIKIIQCEIGDSTLITNASNQIDETLNDYQRSTNIIMQQKLDCKELNIKYIKLKNDYNIISNELEVLIDENKLEVSNENNFNKKELECDSNELNSKYIELHEEYNHISNDYNKLNNRYNIKSAQFASLSMDYKNISNSIELFHLFIPNLTATKEVFCINKTVALQSELIRIILEGDDNESGIKMMNVSVAVIQSVIKYMNYYHQNKGNENLLKQFEDTFVGDNENIKNEILFVAEFMGIDTLIKLLQL